MRYLPLRGENHRGLAPKGCFIPGWNEPAYAGLKEEEALQRAADGEWVGMRLDDYIVIDCDGKDAHGNKDATIAEDTMEGWLKHIDRPFDHTWVRKSKNGYHFIYRRTAENYALTSRKLDTLVPHLELLTGIGHQIVLWAPGYEDLTSPRPVSFNKEWLPEPLSKPKSVEEWDELPDGIGDDFMISVGGKLREWGASENVIFQILTDVNAQVMTKDPMRGGRIKRLARSAVRYDPAPARNIECPACGTDFEVI